VQFFRLELDIEYSLLSAYREDFGSFAYNNTAGCCRLPKS
jgi:hypothetical protein